MQKNVGGYDRLARFIVGPVLLIVGLAALGGWISLAVGTLGVVLAAIALLVGAVLTVTAVIQTCPVNALLGINTYRREGEPRSDVGAEEERPAGRSS